MKKTVFLFMLVIAAYSVYGQTGTCKSGALLWKISGKDLSKPSYLLGTFHLKSGEYLDSIPGAKSALQSCEQVVGEVNMSDMVGMQMQMQQAIMMPSDTTYQMLYSDEDYGFVSEKITSLVGAGLNQLGMLKPVAIHLNVIVLAYAKYFPNINPADILDIRIQSEARNEQKPVVALETADYQIHVLFGIKSLQGQADDLLCSLRNLDKMMALIPKQIEYYDHGDLYNLDQQFKNTEICPSDPSESAALIKDRNDVWMEKLPEIMKDKSSFIAVGALHLAGEDGLLNLLEKSGYKVDPVGL